MDSFEPLRGICQGGPLSPYIFILCMEYLGFPIERECIAKRWTPLKASRENVEVSHLFFTNNLMLFAKASDKGSEAIKDVLDIFCEESGQRMSYEKSCIYFSPNVPTPLKDKIYENSNIQATKNLGKYLGFPIRHKGAPRNQFNFVVERVLTKLAGWKAKFLYFVGQTVLIKSVTATIPNYVMQGAALPTHLRDELDKINRDFLWRSSLKKRKIHLVGWSKIIKCKKERGFGYTSSKGEEHYTLS